MVSQALMRNFLRLTASRRRRVARVCADAFGLPLSDFACGLPLHKRCGLPLHKRSVIHCGWLLMLLLSVGCRKSNEELFVVAVAEVRAERANSIDFREHPIHDEPLIGDLNGLSGLSDLNLDRSQVSDAALKSIGPLPGLSKLSLSRTQVTNDGVKGIASNYPNLIFLRLDETLVDDVGIESLVGLQKLEELSLYRVSVTSRGAAAIAKIESRSRVFIRVGGQVQNQAMQEPKSPYRAAPSNRRSSRYRSDRSSRS